MTAALSPYRLSVNQALTTSGARAFALAARRRHDARSRAARPETVPFVNVIWQDPSPSQAEQPTQIASTGVSE